jgi:hypothetical protein
MHHRTAPIALPGRRCGGCEAHAEGDFIGLRKFGDVAGAHGVAQARYGTVIVFRHLPQRSAEAWKEQPKDQGQRQCLTQYSPGIAQTALPARNGQGAGDTQQGGRRQPAHGDEVGEQPERIAFQQSRQAEEINDERDAVDIALSIGLEQFQTRHQGQQCRAGGQAIEGAEFQEQQCDGNSGNT